MKEALIVLTLLGCDDTGAQCHYLSTASERFETTDECRAASTRLLSHSTDEDYPVIMARCVQPVGIAADGGEPDNIDAVPQPEVEQYPVEIAPVGITRWKTVAIEMVPGRREIRETLNAAASGTKRAGSAMLDGAGAVVEWINPF
jgi:hypothetical protein